MDFKRCHQREDIREAKLRKFIYFPNAITAIKAPPLLKTQTSKKTSKPTGFLLLCLCIKNVEPYNWMSQGMLVLWLYFDGLEVSFPSTCDLSPVGFLALKTFELDRFCF